MKKLLIRTACALLVMLLCSSAAFAGTPSAGAQTNRTHDYMNFHCPIYLASDDDFIFEYFIFHNQATLLRCSPCREDVTDLTIPSALDGYPVTTLDSQLLPASNRIYAMTLPESVTTIAPDAFAGVNFSSVTVSGSHFFMSDRQLMDTDYHVYLTLIKHEIHSVTTTPKSDGTVFVQWQDTHPADSYVLLYRPQAQNSLNTFNNISWLQSFGSTTYPMQRNLDLVVPGIAYDIKIYPAGCEEDAYTMTLTLPQQRYTAHNTKLKSVYFSIYDATLDSYWDAKSPQRIHNISASKVLEAHLDEGKAFTTVLELTHDKMTAEEPFSLMTVVTLPDGYFYAVSDNRFSYQTDYRGGKATSWSYGGGIYDFWTALYNRKDGNFPAGKYQIDIYINGQHLGSTPFTLK